MLHIKSRFRTLTRVSKYFDKTSRYNIGALKKIKRGEKYLKIYCKKKKPIIIEVAKLPWSIFLTFLRNLAETAWGNGSSSRYLAGSPEGGQGSPVCHGPSSTAVVCPSMLMPACVLPKRQLYSALFLMSTVFLMKPVVIVCVGLFILMTPCTSLPL